MGSIKAQVGNDAIGTRSAAMGGCSSTFSDIWSGNNNQAGLGFVKELSGGIYYENRFLLKETSYQAGAFVFPTPEGALGLNLTSFGFELYHETKAGLSYGQRFGDKFSVGIQLNYINVGFSQEYGSKNILTGAIGLITKINKALSIGVHIYNPTRSKLAEYNNERITTVMKIGFSYHFSKKVIGVFETEKDMIYPATLKTGLEYHVNAILYLRGGLSTGPVLNTFGFGLKLKDFNLGIASSYHQTLGLTPSISLIYTR
ncbi:MAG: hypothetical protein J5I47_01150 [Vicingus serpentipes]|nr:hypothetical protein [Vicingus serpentipes]